MIPTVVLICISWLLARLRIFSWVYYPYEFLNIWTLETRVPLLGTAHSYVGGSISPPLGVFAFFQWYEEVLYIAWILFVCYMCCKFYLQVCGVSSFYASINRSLLLWNSQMYHFPPETCAFVTYLINSSLRCQMTSLHLLVVWPWEDT